MGSAEEFTEEQQDTLDALVRAFGIKHSRQFTIRLKVVEGVWQEAEINPQRRLLRKCGTRCRI